MTRLHVIALLASTIVTLAHPVLAEPYIAFREGLKCSTCHVNQTGGGMRTEYGSYYPQTDMQPLLGNLSDASADFSNQVGDSFFLGADFMAVEERSFAVDEVKDGQSYAQDAQHTFDIRRGNIYLEARLAPERLSLYIDETVSPSGASNREAFVLLKGLPKSSYLKVGRMLLPYGIRLWDNDAFIRQVTGFNFDNQDMGAEIGFEPGMASFSLALSNGTQGARDDNSAKQVSSVGSIYFKYLLIGGSFSINETRGIDRTLFGPFASLRLGPLTITGEADWLSESGNRNQDQFIAYGSINYWMRQSVNFRVAFDFLDPYDTVEEDERSRVSIGLDGFLTPNLTASAFYKLKKSIPQDSKGNADALTLALHAFF
ncbi:MAG: hypothetical protein HOA27_07095 [Gemmatimonadetes bacterium]|nr:hypothetical protein [Gemmatimonadota bacterium]